MPKKLTGRRANNCYNFINRFWTLTHPYHILSSRWTRNYSSMSLSVGRSRDDRYRINDERILPLRSSLTTLVVRSWMMAQRNLPGFCCTFRVFVVFIKAVAVSFFVRRGCLTRKTINSLFGAISLKNRRWIDGLDGKRVKKTASVGNHREAHEKWFKTFNSAEASWPIYVSSTPRVSNSWIMTTSQPQLYFPLRFQFVKLLVSIVIMGGLFSCLGNRLDCSINKINTLHLEPSWENHRQYEVLKVLSKCWVLSGLRAWMIMLAQYIAGRSTFNSNNCYT